MEQIITLILFLFPGVLINLLYKEFVPQNKEEQSEYERAIISFLYSFAVLILNILIMKYIFGKDIRTISQLMNCFTYILFLLKYIILTLITSAAVALLWYYKGRHIVRRIDNALRDKRSMPKTTGYPSVWDEIFENPDINLDNTYISIEKDGAPITQGVVGLYSPINKKTKEFKLLYTDTVKAHIENDKHLPDDQKVLGEIDFEYYDIDTGLLIKFYNNTKILEFTKNQSNII